MAAVQFAKMKFERARNARAKHECRGHGWFRQTGDVLEVKAQGARLVSPNGREREIVAVRAREQLLPRGRRNGRRTHRPPPVPGAAEFNSSIKMLASAMDRSAGACALNRACNKLPKSSCWRRALVSMARTWLVVAGRVRSRA